MHRKEDSWPDCPSLAPVDGHPSACTCTSFAHCCEMDKPSPKGFSSFHWQQPECSVSPGCCTSSSSHPILPLRAACPAPREEGQKEEGSVDVFTPPSHLCIIPRPQQWWKDLWLALNVHVFLSFWLPNPLISHTLFTYSTAYRILL